MPPPYETQFFSINAPVGEDSILPRGAILNYRTFVGRIRVNVQRCAIQPNTQLTNLAGGYYPPLQWLGSFVALSHYGVTMTDQLHASLPPRLAAA